MNLVLYLTISQTAFDISLFLYFNLNASSDVQLLGICFFQTFAGGCTNAISYVVAYLFFFRKASTFTLAQYVGLILIPSITFSAVNSAYYADAKSYAIALEVFNAVRISQVGINILLVTFILIQLSRMNIYNGNVKYRAFHKSNKNYP